MLLFILFCLSANFAAMLSQCTPDGCPLPSTLDLGNLMFNGSALESANSRYRATMQIDGNLVVYDKTNKRVIWQSGTQLKTGNVLRLESNGRLSIFDKINRRVWSTGTFNPTPTPLGFTSICVGNSLLMDNSGSLIVRKSDNTPCWDSNANINTNSMYDSSYLWKDQSLISTNGLYNVKQQSDGNLVITFGSAIVTWSTNTTYNPYGFVLFENDGNVLIKDSANTTVWSTEVAEATNRKQLKIEDTGNLVLYRFNGASLWESFDNPTRGVLYFGYRIKFGKKWLSLSGNYYVTVNAAGNLQLFNGTDLAFQSTEGSAGGYAQFTTGGSLVLLNSGGSPVSPSWSTNTDGCGSYATIQDDGNLVVYNRATDKMCWNYRGNTV